MIMESTNTLPVDGTSPTIKAATNVSWIHIDTGATCAVTNLQGELHCPTPSTAQCGTAQHAAKVPITAVGMFIFDLMRRHCQLLPVEVPGACEILGFSR
jgi:hypothetical protein